MHDYTSGKCKQVAKVASFFKNKYEPHQICIDKDILLFFRLKDKSFQRWISSLTDARWAHIWSLWKRSSECAGHCKRGDGKHDQTRRETAGASQIGDFVGEYDGNILTNIDTCAWVKVYR